VFANIIVNQYGLTTLKQSFKLCCDRLNVSQSQAAKVSSEKNAAEQRLIELQRRNVDEETRVLQSSIRMRESVQQLEGSVLDRDQVRDLPLPPSFPL